MSNVIYLKFDTPEQAHTTLIEKGFACVDEWASYVKDSSFVSCFCINNEPHFFCNVYDYYGSEFDDIKQPEPLTPYNVRA